MLRRPVEREVGGEDIVDPRSWSRRVSLRWQLSAMLASMVALSLGMMILVAYLTLSASLAHNVDQDLKEKAMSLISKVESSDFSDDPGLLISEFKEYNPDIRIAYFPPHSFSGIGDNIPLSEELSVVGGAKSENIRTAQNERILSQRSPEGATFILAENMENTQQLTSSLGFALLFVGGVGIFVSVMAGAVAAQAGLRPISRLQSAVDYVATTDDLRPIQVYGDDEIAQLTRSFNLMLAALQNSRDRQTALVADAGHELKTPLTSLRTNIELLMLITKSPNASVSEQDREDLERDVIAQMEELASLVNDLVDLAREESNEHSAEPVDLSEVIDGALDRVRRRRVDVDFHVSTFPWELQGDPFALNRAMVNLLDNAAKWSPANGIVEVTMNRTPWGGCELLIGDSGPGIPLAERHKVFERFYRAIESRSMPGSGLGLAIVKQVITRHGGTISIGDSRMGGALIRIGLQPERLLADRDTQLGNTPN